MTKSARFEEYAYQSLRISDPVIYDAPLTNSGKSHRAAGWIFGIINPDEKKRINRRFCIKHNITNRIDTGDRASVVCLEEPEHLMGDGMWKKAYLLRASSFKLREPTADDVSRADDELKVGDPLIVTDLIDGKVVVAEQAYVHSVGIGSITAENAHHDETKLNVTFDRKAYSRYSCLGDCKTFALPGKYKDNQLSEIWMAAYEERRCRYLTPDAVLIAKHQELIEGITEKNAKLDKQRTDNQFTDCMLLSKSLEEFPAHKCILAAASDVLKTRFEFYDKSRVCSSTSASAAAAASGPTVDPNCIHMEYSSNVVRTLLTAIYTEGEIVGEWRVLLHLMSAAHTLGLTGVFERSCKSLGRIVSEVNAPDVLYAILTFGSAAADRKGQTPDELERIIQTQVALDGLKSKVHTFICEKPMLALALIGTLKSNVHELKIQLSDAETQGFVVSKKRPCEEPVDTKDVKSHSVVERKDASDGSASAPPTTTSVKSAASQTPPDVVSAEPAAISQSTEIAQSKPPAKKRRHLPS